MIPLKKSKLLSQFTEITHAFTTKDGGVSKNNYSSLNLAFHVGDKEDDVLKNHSILSKSLSYERRTLVHMDQIHSDIVYQVDRSDNFDTRPTCDALITNERNKPLMVMVADCSPILFYDNVQKVIAVAHAGRAGAFLNIVQKTLDSFIKNYHSNPENIYVSVGANISTSNYEVNKAIFDEAKALDLEFAVEVKEDRYFLDIRKILYKQLLEGNVKKENIEISQECSFLETEYFSYRANGITGRFAGVITLL